MRYLITIFVILTFIFGGLNETFAATLATDNFNRADGGLGSSWTTAPSQLAPQISSNVVVDPTNDGYDVSAFYNGVAWPNDQYSKVTAVTLTTTSGPGVSIRSSSSVKTLYFGFVDTPGASANIIVYKVVTGTYTVIGSTTGTVNNGDIVQLQAVGTTIGFLVNGVSKISTTDSDISSGNAGVHIADESGNGAQLDDWEGGDFTTLAPASGTLRTNGGGTLQIKGGGSLQIK